MANITISVGTGVHVSLGEPTSYNIAGFEAKSYTEIGEVGSVPTFGGTSQVSEFIPIKTGIVNKRVGSTNYGSSALPIANVFSDAGQILLLAGFDGANRGKVHSIKLINAEIGIVYFTAVITSYKYTIGDANAITQAEVTLELINKPLIDVDLVTVTYAAGANGACYGVLAQTLLVGATTSVVYAAPLNTVTHKFSQWNDASTENPRNDVAATNITYTASFIVV